jgi:hypothetical protein
LWSQTFHLNTLETLYLVTAMFILLAGMAFQSGVAEVGTSAYNALAYAVIVVLVVSVTVFVSVFMMEAVWAVRFASRVRRATRKAIAARATRQGRALGLGLKTRLRHVGPGDIGPAVVATAEGKCFAVENPMMQAAAASSTVVVRRTVVAESSPPPPPPPPPSQSPSRFGSQRRLSMRDLSEADRSALVNKLQATLARGAE